MDENIESSGEESDNDSILDSDLHPDGVIGPFMFEPQHSSPSGEEEISVDEEIQKRFKEKHLRAHFLEISSGAHAVTVKRCQQKTSVCAVKK